MVAYQLMIPNLCIGNVRLAKHLWEKLTCVDFTTGGTSVEMPNKQSATRPAAPACCG